MFAYISKNYGSYIIFLSVGVLKLKFSDDRVKSTKWDMRNFSQCECLQKKTAIFCELTNLIGANLRNEDDSLILENDVGVHPEIRTIDHGS